MPTHIPQCFRCRHFREDAGAMVCSAFPEEIPQEILMNQFDHRQPHSGDHGIRFEEGGPLSDPPTGTAK